MPGLTVAAIVPTIDGRGALLAEALASIDAQTRPVDELHVVNDSARYGPGYARNQAAGDTSCDWLAFLDDDDLWLPNHLDVLTAASLNADVVYSWCRVDGERERFDHNRPFDPVVLADHNFIPVTTLVRADAFHEVGGFDPEADPEDWDLWLRMDRAGARFVAVPIETWVYRVHSDDQRTFRGE